MNAFDNVIGYENLKREMMMICDAMKNPDKYAALGVTVPKGVLFYGEPGIGKSLMAKAIIKESGRTSFILRKDKPNGKFVDEIRRVFEEASAKAPSIILLDDMDKFANGDENHRDTEEFVTVQACIDSVHDKEVFVIATVNDKDVLPYSLTRPGRFDKVILMRCPEGEDSEIIVKHFLDQKKIDEDVDAKEIARILSGRSCADLEIITNEAGMYAAFDNRDKLSHFDLIQACLRYIFDAPFETEYCTDADFRSTAIHEAGHVVLAEIFNPGSVNLVSISGVAGSRSGVTSITKPKDYWDSKKSMENWAIGLLGGKAATEVVKGVVDVGSTSDIDRAFRIVRRFVCDYCSSDFNSFDARYSSDIPKENMDRQAAIEMENYYRIAKKTIVENMEFFNAVVDMLMDKKTITTNDIKEIREKQSNLNL